MTKEEFYRKCSEILGVDIPYKEINLTPKVDWETGQLIQRTTLASRWSGREPGNGRVPGFGLIRWYSEIQIHVNLVAPYSISKVFASPDAVFDALLKKRKELKEI